jgi:hypothetical protein
VGASGRGGFDGGFGFFQPAAGAKKIPNTFFDNFADGAKKISNAFLDKMFRAETMPLDNAIGALSISHS